MKMHMINDNAVKNCIILWVLQIWHIKYLSTLEKFRSWNFLIEKQSELVSLLVHQHILMQQGVFYYQALVSVGGKMCTFHEGMLNYVYDLSPLDP